MMINAKKFAAAGLAFAAFAAPHVASAQPISDPAVVQPLPVAPVTTTTTTAYPAVPGAVAATPYTAGPPPMTGAMAGTTAADRDGDGIVDGYYTSDGYYHPYVVPQQAPAPTYVSRRGERG